MKLLLVILKNAWFVIKNYFGWIIRYSKKQSSYSIQHRYERLRNFLVEFGKRLNLKLYISGLDNIKDDENYFFTPNHQGILDPLLYIMAVEKTTSFVCKYEGRKIPFIKETMLSIDGEFMKRDDLRQSLKVIKNVSNDLAADVKSWLVFPEGTRTKNENFALNEFKYGTFKVALNSKKAIIPVAISGSWRIFSDKTRMKYYPIQFSFLKPIPYEVYKDMKTKDLAAYVENLVREEHQRLLANEPKLIKELNPKIKKII